MTKEEFRILINRVSPTSFKIAQHYLINKLQPKFKYDVYLNQSQENSSQSKFDYYPEENDKIETKLTNKEVCDLLYRNGKLPVWIDIFVYQSDTTTTTFKLICAGRYSEDEKEYYYHSKGTGPFGIKSPILPSSYKEGTKFNLRN